MATYTLKAGHQRTFFLGEPRKHGEHVVVGNRESLPAYDREALAAHFDCIAADEEKAEKKPAPKFANGLTPEQAREKLAKAGVQVLDNESDKDIEDLFNRVFAQTLPPANVPPANIPPANDGAGKAAEAKGAKEEGN